MMFEPNALSTLFTEPLRVDDDDLDDDDDPEDEDDDENEDDEDEEEDGDEPETWQVRARRSDSAKGRLLLDFGH